MGATEQPCMQVTFVGFRCIKPVQWKSLRISKWQLDEGDGIRVEELQEVCSGKEGALVTYPGPVCFKII